MATRRRTSTRRKKNNSKKTGCLVWLIPLSLGLILLLANNSVRESIARFIQDMQGKETPPGTVRPGRNPEVINSIISRDMRRQEEKNLQVIRRQIQEADKKNKPTSSEKTPKKSSKKQIKKILTNKKKDQRLAFQATIYFVRYDAAHDKILLTPVRRKIRKTATPAYTLLAELLKGPNQKETKRGMRTLIPAGTRIKGLHVASGIIHINLSKNFIRGQKFGKEGLVLQIYQIVNSMSQFSTVRGVRFRINGKTLQTAGGDWVRLDRIFRKKDRPLA